MNEFTDQPTGRCDTDAVHCGERRWLGSLTTPIALTSTFVFIFIPLARPVFRQDSIPRRILPAVLPVRVWVPSQTTSSTVCPS